MSAKIRKIVVVVEETREEMGREISPPTRRAAALAVIANPFADRFQDDLEILMQIGEELGQLLGDKAVAALDRSEESRVGQEGVSQGSTRRSPSNKKKKKKNTK